MSGEIRVGINSHLDEVWESVKSNERLKDKIVHLSPLEVNVMELDIKFKTLVTFLEEYLVNK